jgi:hypothetical protein
MAKLTKFDIVEFEAHSNNVTIRKSENGEYTFSDYAEQYARQKVLEELETQLMKYRKEYYDGRCFADDIEQRIKELKEVKQ